MEAFNFDRSPTRAVGATVISSALQRGECETRYSFRVPEGRRSCSYTLFF